MTSGGRLSAEREQEIRDRRHSNHVPADPRCVCCMLDELLAEIDALRAEMDGPSGLREQLVAVVKGEQIEHRLRKKAEDDLAALRTAGDALADAADEGEGSWSETWPTLAEALAGWQAARGQEEA